MSGVFIVSAARRSRPRKCCALGHLVSFHRNRNLQERRACARGRGRLVVRRVHGRNRLSVSRPHPFRGKRCEPAHAALVAEHRRGAWHFLDELARATTKTAEEFSSSPDEVISAAMSRRSVAFTRGALQGRATGSLNFVRDGSAVVALVTLASCASVDRRHQVIISIPRAADGAVLEDGAPLATYPVSTSKFGLGDLPGAAGRPWAHSRSRRKSATAPRAAPLSRSTAHRRNRVLRCAGSRHRSSPAFSGYAARAAERARVFALHLHSRDTGRAKHRAAGELRLRPDAFSADVIELFAIVGTGAQVKIENAPLEALVPGLKPVEDRFISTHNFAPTKIR